MTKISQITSAAHFLLVRQIGKGRSRAKPVPLSHYKNSGEGKLCSSHSSPFLSLTFLNRQGPRLTSLSKWVGNLARHSSRRSFHSCLAAQTNATDFEPILASQGDHVFKQKKKFSQGIGNFRNINSMTFAILPFQQYFWKYHSKLQSVISTSTHSPIHPPTHLPIHPPTGNPTRSWKTWIHLSSPQKQKYPKQ